MDLKAVIETEVERFGVPGAAVAVVAGGEVLLSEGFGMRDDEAPVTSQTLYMIASDSKAFAAATVCQLVEEGVLDLDAPVQDVLPWFEMHDPAVSSQVTPRDLLAHTTGLPRHDFVTIGDGGFHQGNEQITWNMRHLEASRPFRSGFGYNNCHYVAAGHLVEVVTGRPWKDVVQDRVLDPVGMRSSGTYSPDLLAGDIAAPYQSRYGERVRLPFQTRHHDKPSGGIVSCADDLAQWMLARLGSGALNAEVVRLLHTPCVEGVATPGFPEVQPVGYGLGVRALDYRGHRVLFHGGGQLGYSGQVLVVPSAGLGVSVHTNEHASQLPLALSLVLLDHLLGLQPAPWGERLSVAPSPAAPPATGEQRPARDLHEHVGTFAHPAYDVVRTWVEGGVLRADFHDLGDQVELTHLDLDDWTLTFRDFPGLHVPMSFRAGADGRVDALTLGLEPELAPLVFTRTP